MQNQAAVEALYSATFVEDYIDCVENLPNELQRNLSVLREYDLLQHKEFLCELDDLVDSFERDTSLVSQKNALLKIQQGLITTQDIGDSKLATVQVIADLIENKSRQLEHDSRNLDFGRGEEEKKTSKDNNRDSKSSGVAGKLSKNKNTDDRPVVKRRKKQLQDKKDDKEDSRNNGSTSFSARGSKGVGKKPGTKRRAAIKKLSTDKDDSDKEDIDLGMEYDPDEPTYCLCDQISYGEMIGCDNDLCPIEWFHFNCVQLSNKPKGKWFCPKCRGDKSTAMKPKAQFLKELEKYNKEREEKLMKQNG